MSIKHKTIHSIENLPLSLDQLAFIYVNKCTFSLVVSPKIPVIQLSWDLFPSHNRSFYPLHQCKTEFKGSALMSLKSNLWSASSSISPIKALQNKIKKDFMVGVDK